jgi:calcium-dependent protein kinase
LIALFKIVHRDLKPENFLLDSEAEDANLKVIDFGTAQFFNSGMQMRQKYGTAYYIAPEVLRRSYDQSCDVWSAGVNLYIMLSGFPPFGGQSDEQILKKVAAGRYSFPSPEWDLVSFEAKDLITKMLTLDPSRRISATEALQHPWLLNASKISIDSHNSKALFRNLKNFRAERRLQKATLSYIISQIVTQEEKAEMLELFKSLDKDSSGTLNKAELMDGFHHILGDIMEDVESEVENIIAQVDVNGSGEIDYSEFVLATMNRHKLLSREKLNRAFKAFDMDGNGTISADELKSVLGRQHSYDDQVWAELVREADTNGDGVIDLKEFTAMMLAMN